MDIWRISSFADLSGRGGLLADGRWHRQGLLVIYCADHPSTALLEILVHLDPEDIPARYQLLRISCPDNVPVGRIEDLDPSDLDVTRERGSALLEENRHLLINVPSVVMPAARNILINPRHGMAGALSITEIFHYPFDSRMKT